MKKLILVLCVLFLIPGAVVAQSPDFSAYDAQLYTFAANISTLQHDALLATNNYLQMLPVDVATVSGTGYDSGGIAAIPCPSDATSCISNVGLLPDGDLSLAVNVYRNVSGAGYEIVATADISGTLYRKTYNVGPESWRNRDWSAVPEFVE